MAPRDRSDDERFDQDQHADRDRPIGEGVGAAGGAVSGMAIGASVGGPPGAVIGAAVGAVAGGAIGHGVAAAIDPDAEDAYWRENYSTQPYIRPGFDYTDYGPAYRYGWESRARASRDWDSTQLDLESGWDRARGGSRLGWDDARDAVRAGWQRVEPAVPGDTDRDGR